MSFSNFPRIVHRLISPISGEIIVKEQLGQHTLLVEGIPQSGGIVAQIWKKGVKKLPNLGKVPNVLLLGLGGGTVVNLLKKRWPQTRILAVEIDPQIVVIGRTYFGLDKIPGLKIITDDAFKVVSGKKAGIEEGKFDLVLVDVYLGKKLPGFVGEEDFISQLKKLLSSKGIIVFNYLLDEVGKETVGSFEGKVKKIFPKMSVLQTASNELIFAYQR